MAKTKNEFSELINSQTDEEICGKAVGQVAEILSVSIAQLDSYIAERMLRMIIALCQSELKGGNGNG